jgi:hypothetical protein
MTQITKAALCAVVFISMCFAQIYGNDTANTPGTARLKDSLAHRQPEQGKSLPQKFDLVSPALFDSFLTVLSNQGIVIDKNTVAAMGFSRDSSDTAKRLFVISLDGAGQPAKRTFPIGQATPGLHGNQPVKLRQDGRVYFMINCALKSLFVYPSGLSMAFPNANGQVIIGVALLALGGSLYGSYAYTQKMELGYGRVEMMNYGGDLGVAYPMLLAGFCETSGGFNPSPTTKSFFG